MAKRPSPRFFAIKSCVIVGNVRIFSDSGTMESLLFWGIDLVKFK
jgi:hypothetical protein